MQEDQTPLKMDATAKPVPREINSLRELAPGSVFKMGKSGTAYLMTRDGSIRNVAKAINKQLKLKGGRKRRHAIAA